MRHSQTSAGYTILEVLVVILLMAILAGVLLPHSQPAIHEQLLSAAEVVASDLNYARSLAVTYGSRFGLRFDTEANAYSVEHFGADAALDTVPESIYADSRSNSGGYVVQLDDLPRVGPSVRLVGVVDTSAPSMLVEQIVFEPLGNLVSHGTQQVWLSAGSGDSARYISVSVNPTTGLVDVGSCTNTIPTELASPR